MTLSSELIAFLADATGLSRTRVTDLYWMGYPWPVLTAYDVRWAASYAQSHAIPFSQALEISMDLAQREGIAMAELFERLEHTTEAADRQRILEAIQEAPWMKELLDHCRRVAHASEETFPVIFRLAYALERFATDHPDWDPDEDGLAAGMVTLT